MIYLESFTIPNGDTEDKYLLNYPYLLEMQCYSHTNIYPFRVLSKKQITTFMFDNITFLYGSNGSGKTTLLNTITQKLLLERSSDFNNTPYFNEYLKFCSYGLPQYSKGIIPQGSKIITSDDVFDYLLDIRAFNKGVANKRDFIFQEYETFKQEEQQIPDFLRLQDMDHYSEFKKRLEISRKSKSQYTAKNLNSVELDFRSNGENAFRYFTENITSDALYLLDEPENSLSAELQLDLLRFIENSARFYNCQFIISTHSPFLLSLKNALIYDLDTIPTRQANWKDLGSVKTHSEFFKQRM